MIIFFFKQKTAYEMRISDWSSDVCSSDLHAAEIKPGELVESEAKTLLGLGLAPGLGKLRAALFLQDAGQLGFKAAVNLLLGQADAEEARGAIGPDISA